MLAEEPQCGCTFAWSAPNSSQARFRASSSAASTGRQPEYQRFPGYPSAYLFISTLPAARRTAREEVFSEAMRLISVSSCVTCALIAA